LNLFKEQVKNETSYLLPLVFEYEPSIWDVYTRGHQKAANLARNLESDIQSYKKSKEADDKSAAIELIKKAYQEFMQFNFIHMDDEEEVLNEILWRYYKDDYIQQLEEQINGTPALIKQHKNVRRYEAANAA
jgi:hemerythrin-like domain-containing protein